MKPIFSLFQLRMEQRIVTEFGDGRLRGDQHLFDQIHLPTGWTERLATPSEILEIVERIGGVVVLFDRDPDNIRLTMEYLRKLDLPLVTGAEVNVDELRALLSCDQCDMYIVTPKGELLAVPCHEDAIVDGIRQIWMPVRPGDTATQT